MVSNTKNMEVCDRHARHRSGTYINVPCIQTYRWKEKLPRIQGSLQKTKTLILKPGKDLREFIGALHEGEYAVTH